MTYRTLDGTEIPGLNVTPWWKQLLGIREPDHEWLCPCARCKRGRRWIHDERCDDPACPHWYAAAKEGER